MQSSAFGHSFNRGDVAAFSIESQHQTRQNRSAINQDRAGATLTQLTAMLRSRQAEIFAQDFEQGLMRRECDLGGLAIEAERNMTLLIHSDPANKCLTSSWESTRPSSAALRRSSIFCLTCRQERTSCHVASGGRREIRLSACSLTVSISVQATRWHLRRSSSSLPTPHYQSAASCQ